MKPLTHWQKHLIEYWGTLLISALLVVVVLSQFVGTWQRNTGLVLISILAYQLGFFLTESWFAHTPLAKRLFPRWSARVASPDIEMTRDIANALLRSMRQYDIDAEMEEVYVERHYIRYVIQGNDAHGRVRLEKWLAEVVRKEIGAKKVLVTDWAKGGDNFFAVLVYPGKKVYKFVEEDVEIFY